MASVLQKMIGSRVVMRAPHASLLYLPFTAGRRLDLLIVCMLTIFRSLCMHSGVIA